MDLSKTGAFIAERRKAKNLTQVELAIKLNVSEKTISKWECGYGFPDTSLMLPLCKELDISANELLSGKLLSDKEYKENAENNLIALKNKEEKNAKLLLTIEWVMMSIITILFLGVVFLGYYMLNNNTTLGIILIISSIILLATAVMFALKIEQDAGYYECKKCHYKYIPTYKSVLIAMHYGTTRYMKCPHCKKRSWHKKTITKD